MVLPKKPSGPGVYQQVEEPLTPELRREITRQARALLEERQTERKSRAPDTPVEEDEVLFKLLRLTTSDGERAAKLEAEGEHLKKAVDQLRLELSEVQGVVAGAKSIRWDTLWKTLCGAGGVVALVFGWAVGGVDGRIDDRFKVERIAALEAEQLPAAVEARQKAADRIGAAVGVVSRVAELEKKVGELEAWKATMVAPRRGRDR